MNTHILTDKQGPSRGSGCACAGRDSGIPPRVADGAEARGQVRRAQRGWGEFSDRLNRLVGNSRRHFPVCQTGSLVCDLHSWNRAEFKLGQRECGGGCVWGGFAGMSEGAGSK